MSLKKIKIQIPTVKRLLFFSVIFIVVGSIGIYALSYDLDLFWGTLCTSLVLLINIQFWIMIVKRLISIVTQFALEAENDSIQKQQLNTEKKIESQELNRESYVYDQEDGQLKAENDGEIQLQTTNYVPNTGGVYVFFFLKISFLIVLLTVCAFVFSPLCIIFSNTIIVFSLLSSSFRVI